MTLKMVLAAAAVERQSGLKLYWVTTPDGDEDWFVLAKNRREAERYHEGYEGYNPRYAKAEALMIVASEKLPKQSTPENFPRHAQLQDLKCLGFIIGATGDQRMVMLGERIFTEGGLEHKIDITRDDILEAEGKGRPNGTVRTISDGELERRYQNYQANMRRIFDGER